MMLVLVPVVKNMLIIQLNTSHKHKGSCKFTDRKSGFKREAYKHDITNSLEANADTIFNIHMEYVQL